MPAPACGAGRGLSCGLCGVSRETYELIPCVTSRPSPDAPWWADEQQRRLAWAAGPEEELGWAAGTRPSKEGVGKPGPCTSGAELQHR